jgi:histidyl-tRNA synthetase
MTLHLNSLGDAQSKAAYSAALRDFFTARQDQLSEESKRRLETNPLRILDSRDPKDATAREGAPANTEFLSDGSRKHFERVRELLDSFGVACHLNTGLVRGLDYYTETLWEFTAIGLGSQDAIGGGGRYNNLVETLGGKSTPGVGFGIGLERLLLSLEAQGAVLPETYLRPVWVIAQSATARDEALHLVRSLRRGGIAADMDYTARSVKAQFKLADRAQATHCLILGDYEMEQATVAVKDLETGEQRSVEREKVLELFSPREGGPH